MAIVLRHEFLLGMVVYTFSLKFLEAEVANLCDFKVSLVYKSSRRAREVTMRKPISENKQISKHKDDSFQLLLQYYSFLCACLLPRSEYNGHVLAFCNCEHQITFFISNIDHSVLSWQKKSIKNFGG